MTVVNVIGILCVFNFGLFIGIICMYNRPCKYCTDDYRYTQEALDGCWDDLIARDAHIIIPALSDWMDIYKEWYGGDIPTSGIQFLEFNGMRVYGDDCNEMV